MALIGVATSSITFSGISPLKTLKVLKINFRREWLRRVYILRISENPRFRNYLSRDLHFKLSEIMCSSTCSVDTGCVMIGSPSLNIADSIGILASSTGLGVISSASGAAVSLVGSWID